MPLHLQGEPHLPSPVLLPTGSPRRSPHSRPSQGMQDMTSAAAHCPLTALSAERAGLSPGEHPRGSRGVRLVRASLPRLSCDSPPQRFPEHRLGVRPWAGPWDGRWMHDPCPQVTAMGPCPTRTRRAEPSHWKGEPQGLGTVRPAAEWPASEGSGVRGPSLRVVGSPRTFTRQG